jgi:hypothetical protein
VEVFTGNTVKILQASASRIIRSVDRLIEMSDQMIKFPQREEHADIKQQFYEIGQTGRLHWDFPNVSPTSTPVTSSETE